MLVISLSTASEPFSRSRYCPIKASLVIGPWERGSKRKGARERPGYRKRERERGWESRGKTWRHRPSAYIENSVTMSHHKSLSASPLMRYSHRRKPRGEKEKERERERVVAAEGRLEKKVITALVHGSPFRYAASSSSSFRFSLLFFCSRSPSFLFLHPARWVRFF